MAEEYISNPFRNFYLGFFHEQQKRMNWRNVENADINQIVKVKIIQGDLRPLNNLLEDLAYVDIYKDDFIDTNPEVYKMLKIMQTGMQYFLFFQSQLKGVCKESHEAADHEIKENKRLKDAAKKQKSKIRKLRKEIENLDLRSMHYDMLSEVLKAEGAPLDFKKIESKKLIKERNIKSKDVYVADMDIGDVDSRGEKELLESIDFQLSVSKNDKDLPRLGLHK
ncbi:hypothetical protein SteCoe_10394 [Stentor coeruleus]|uniref:Cilium assembly protein DZIP1 N-terminal domain-containing protein n=1 Tax=Stentor coeruleus TaxID=5963 RepID=A0A1R2CFW3_9CILI|nr:hypothetical protein SteCoe_10394 [Stentor coeruleus]